MYLVVHAKTGLIRLAEVGRSRWVGAWLTPGSAVLGKSEKLLLTRGVTFSDRGGLACEKHQRASAGGARLASWRERSVSRPRGTEAEWAADSVFTSPSRRHCASSSRDCQHTWAMNALVPAPRYTCAPPVRSRALLGAFASGYLITAWRHLFFLSLGELYNTDTWLNLLRRPIVSFSSSITRACVCERERETSHGEARDFPPRAELTSSAAL